MSEPWFDENLYAWIPGTLLGVLGGLWGSLVGVLGPRGRARTLVLGFTWALLLASVGLLALGVAALLAGQPYGVWYSLALPGLLGLIVIGGNTFTLYWAYRQAEARKMTARDLTEESGGPGSPHSNPSSFRLD